MRLAPDASGLVAYWDFDEVSNNETKTAVPSGAQALTATLHSGVGWTEGRYGGGLAFDGVDDRVASPSTAAFDISGTKLTIAFWVHVPVQPQGSGEQAIVLRPWNSSSWEAPYYHYGVTYLPTTGQVKFYFANTNGDLKQVTLDPIAKGIWTHVAFTFNSGWVDGFVNGVNVLHQQRPGPIASVSNSPLRIGVEKVSSPQMAFEGKLDEVRLYNTALTEREVQVAAGLLQENSSGVQVLLNSLKFKQSIVNNDVFNNFANDPELHDLITGVNLKIGWQWLQLGPNQWDWDFLTEQIEHIHYRGYNTYLKIDTRFAPDWIYELEHEVSKFFYKDSVQGTHYQDAELPVPWDEDYLELVEGLLTELQEQLQARLSQEEYDSIVYIGTSSPGGTKDDFFPSTGIDEPRPEDVNDTRLETRRAAKERYNIDHPGYFSQEELEDDEVGFYHNYDEEWVSSAFTDGQPYQPGLLADAKRRVFDKLAELFPDKVLVQSIFLPLSPEELPNGLEKDFTVELDEYLREAAEQYRGRMTIQVNALNGNVNGGGINTQYRWALQEELRVLYDVDVSFESLGATGGQQWNGDLAQYFITGLNRGADSFRIYLNDLNPNNVEFYPDNLDALASLQAYLGADQSPPSIPSNLTANGSGASADQVVLTWSAPADDSFNFNPHASGNEAVGVVKGYLLKMSTTGPITTDAQFNAAQTVDIGIVPAMVDGQETFVVSNLNPFQTVHFALKAIDDAGRLSPFSISATASARAGGESLWYTFEQGSSITDVSGNGNNGVQNGSTVTFDSGRNSNVLGLNGNDDYVSVANLGSLLAGDATLAFWIKTQQPGNNTVTSAPVVTGNNPANTDNDIFWGYLNGAGKIGVKAKNGANVLSTNPINDNTWHFIAITRNATTGEVRIYVDGNTPVTGTSGAGVIAGGEYLGKLFEGSNPDFNGRLDDVRIFQRVLSAAEIDGIYAGDYLTAAGPEQTGGTARTLGQRELAPIVAEAMARWQDAGFDVRGLTGVQFVIADLGGNRLARANGMVITLDVNAAGYGWFVDRTPSDDREFDRRRPPRGIDLLTVVTHELGHVLGLEHAEPGGVSVMAETLGTGERHSPSAADLDALFSLLAPDVEEQQMVILP